VVFDRVINTARFGADKVREVYAVEGVSGVVRRTRNWRRKRRAIATAPSRLVAGPLPQPPRWHTHVLSVAEGSLPQCYHYRVEQKREICSHLGVPFDDVPVHDVEEAISRLQLASILLVYRLSADPGLLRIVAEAERLHVPVIYEVDDLIYRREVTQANPNLDTLPKSLRTAVIHGSDGYREALAYASFNLASTKALAEDMTQINGRPGFVVENGIDSVMLEIAEGLDLEPRIDDAGDHCVISYGSGSRAHDHDFALTAPALRLWLEDHPHGRIKLIGPVRIPEILQPYGHRIDRNSQTLAYGEYLRELRNSTMTLAPLTSDHFNVYKSQVKYLEAALVGVPLVASPMVYANYIEHGRTGLIAHDTEGWLQALTLLAGDGDLRRSMSQAAREHVRQWELPNRPAQQMSALIAAMSEAVAV
jgi:glycosyltransferase involved in cell wall biosynthesis